MAAWNFLKTSLLVYGPCAGALVASYQTYHPFSNSAEKVPDPQAENIGFTFDLRAILLFLQIGFSFVGAAVAFSILLRTFGLDLPPETTAPTY